MKTKLLKRIRKRYTIKRIDAIDWDDYDQITAKNEFGVPFYEADGPDTGKYVKNFHHAQKVLIEMIQQRYRKKVKESKSVKVWWTN